MTLSPLLSLSVVEDRAHVRVVARGEIDMDAADALDARLRGLWDAGWNDMTLDLRGVTFIDTTAVYVLLAAHHAASERGGGFSVIAAPGPVRRLLARTGVDRVLTVGHPPTAP
ncbi:STAS domain-containing protein [Baekduia soli]|uniref:STAS domain-containing protein n=1 Tax=Baekduia soli TaxID=496014 RepID=A0A5B8U6S4_9ACTN|nr:STAS domain-containing protein [Baekduia soli]QEC48710.1 STAS domain-containing protein [Baekduia soli]